MAVTPYSGGQLTRSRGLYRDSERRLSMSFARKIVTCVCFFALSVLLSACGSREMDPAKKKEIATKAQEQFKQYQKKTGKK